MAKTLTDQILFETDTALLTQNNNGSFPGGHNGPYFDIETPVRNTAHWVFTLCKMYQKTGEKKYFKPIEQGVKYLLSDEARPMNASFYCRTNPQKDLTNGVIGQAWVMEALLEVTNTLDREDCYKLAEEIFLMHPWLPGLKVWRVVNVDGSYNVYDPTFNHQLWFAAVGSLLKNTENAQELSLSFLENSLDILKLYDDGVIYHLTPFQKFKLSVGQVVNKINYLNKVKPYFFKESELYKKSVGYHAFNLYAFGILKQSFPDHKVWTSKKFKKIMDACNKSKFQALQNNNKYSYPYNPTGIELAFAFEQFGNNDDRGQFWIDSQLKTTSESDSIMTKSSEDITTAKARIYEACRLNNEYSINQ